MRLRLKRKIRIYLILGIFGLFLITSVIIYSFLGHFRSFFWNIPGLAGFIGPRHYLVLLQNNNELRPTGGFITAVADVSFIFGYPRIRVFDSYQIPDPDPRIPAPEPFQYFIGQNDPFFGGWTLRDANFSPDFNQSSQSIIDLYQKAYPDSSIDGVIALDFTVIEKLLEIYGPITVEDITFDSQNFFINSQKISKNIDTHNITELTNRKNILGPFTKALINKIIFRPGKYGKLSNTLFELNQRKDLLLYSSSRSLQDKLHHQNLSHAISNSSQNSDFIHVNIANIGGRKADRYIQKDIKYLADFSDPDHPYSTLTIALEHLGSYNIQSDVYQAYIRSYVPLDSRLISASGSYLRGSQTFTDLNLTVFADYIRLKPGEQITLEYNYRLPELIIPENYQLRIIKQPGVSEQWWRVAVKQINDSTMSNSDSSSQDVIPMIIRENLAFWQGELNHNLHFQLLKQQDKDGPIILWQEFKTLNTINIRFNELIDQASAQNTANYQITDLNKKHTQTDQVTVTQINFSGKEQRDLWLSVSGITTQPEEHYQIKIRDIQDTNGNTSSPNPVIRTLVQRITP